MRACERRAVTCVTTIRALGCREAAEGNRGEGGEREGEAASCRASEAVEKDKISRLPLLMLPLAPFWNRRRSGVLRLLLLSSLPFLVVHCTRRREHGGRGRGEHTAYQCAKRSC